MEPDIHSSEKYIVILYSVCMQLRTSERYHTFISAPYAELRKIIFRNMHPQQNFNQLNHTRSAMYVEHGYITFGNWKSVQNLVLFNLSCPALYAKHVQTTSRNLDLLQIYI